MPHISKATEYNWKKLNSDSTKKLTKRANKTLSAKKVIASTYANSSNADELLNLVCDIKAPVADILLSLCVNVLQVHNIWHMPHVQSVMSDYIGQYNLLELDIPNSIWETNEDLLGFILQSLQTEGERNATGQYYTNRDIVRHMIGDLVLANDENFFDPCCGSGAFLLGVKTSNPELLYGSDINPVAVMVAKVNLLVKYSDRVFVPHIYCVDFLLNSATIGYEKEGYDELFSHKYKYIYTNPPWGADKKGLYHVPYITSKERSSMFLVKALSMLQPNGHVYFLVPTSLLNIAVHRDVRNFILTKNTIKHIELYKDRFDGVYTDYFSILLEPSSAEKQCYTVGDDTNIVLPIMDAHQSEIVLRNKDEYEEAILSKMDSLANDYLTHSQWALGIVTGDNKGKVLTEATSLSEEIYTGKEVAPYRLQKAKKHIVYAPDTFQQCAKDEYYRAPEKLIYRFIAKYPIVAYDNEQKLCLNSANILIPEIAGISVRCVGALLNSALYRFYYMQKFTDLKVLKSNLQKLPFPKLNEEQRLQLKSVVSELYRNNVSTADSSQLDLIIFSIFGLSKHEQEYVYSHVSQ